jgi:2-keto-4-pentenoate hydratase/2-oxohepta-3-ene-1,7-dioic acid hydratase in catechol pathway
MRIAHYRHRGRHCAGIVSGDTVIPAGDDLLRPVPVGEPLPLEAVELLAPVVPAAKIICVGLNYADHAAESGDEAPNEPLLFAKLPNSLVGASEPIVLPDLSDRVDFEAELGVVIGRRARRVTPDEARHHIFGYTCVNDVSARDLQLGDGQWTRGKSLDTFCPVGPWVVTSDDVPDPQALGIRCLLNGKVMQDSSTALMLFGVDTLVSYISQGITLEPGDLIATGTPPGVGFTREPPVYLADGDVVRVEIDAVGVLESRVVDAATLGAVFRPLTDVQASLDRSVRPS